MVSKKQKIKIKKRRSIGGVNAQGALKTVFDGQVAAATNANQQRLTTSDFSKQAQALNTEIKTELWKSGLTGNFNTNKIGKRLEARKEGLQKMGESTSKLLEQVGITGLANKAGITDITKQVSIPSVGFKPSLNSARKSGSNLVKSASNSFSGMTKSATNGMCIIL